jgi:serine/threonine-protein kinase HipA
MAMKLGSRYKFSEVHARHWDQFAQEAGLSVAQTRKRILDLAKRLPLAARKLALEPGSEFAGHSLVGQIVDLIEQRAVLTIRRLTERAVDVGLSGD